MGIKMSENLENEVGSIVKPSSFYYHRGNNQEDFIKRYESDEEIEFVANNDVYDLMLIDSEDDSNVFYLGFHSNHEVELDSIKLGKLIRENG
jgi:hypothetical protein